MTSFSPLRHRRSNSGFALVMVLGILVLLVALSVGFLMRASTERSASSGFQASVYARQLADTAVSLVQGQINIATTQGPTVAWVSQPGMVRTFDVNGAMLNAYKLYSAPSMIATTLPVTAGVFPDTPATADAWPTSPAVWTDLNSPVEANGVKNFPILDPPSTDLLNSPPPLGYSVTSAPGATGYQPVPMPVRWLYVLRNGKLTAAAGTGSAATVDGETSSNPIIGRIAFWTDDETCKVNINTASEGTFWDVPRADTSQEQSLGSFQPAQREFQRYPGHPAMTSLSAVFRSLAATPANSIFNLAPRTRDGGSNAGTTTPTAAMAPKSERLYASVDELMFKQEGRTENSGITRSQIEQAKFFITAQSRAPETTLFNLPRIACWPIFKNQAAGRVTAFDKLIAFCSSTGPASALKPYYFQREKADSPTYDLEDTSMSRNRELYGYLRDLTGKPIPGFGGNFLAKYGDDRDQILTEIFDYIRCTNLHDDLLAPNKQFSTYWASTASTKTSIPSGYGWVAPIHYKPGSVMTMGIGRTFTLSEFGIGFICNADGNDTTLGSNTPATNTVLGGVALAANEKSIQAILLPEFFSPMLGYVALCPNMRIEVQGMDQIRLTAPIAANLFPTPSGNTKYDWVSAIFDQTRIWGGNPSWLYPLYWKGSPPLTNLSGGVLAGDAIGDSMGTGSGFPIKDIYPFVSNPVKIPAAGGFMTMSDANLVVSIYAKASASPTSENLIQTFNIKLPGGVFPIPKLANKNVSRFDAPPPTYQAPAQSWWTFAAKGIVTGQHGRFYYTGKEIGGSGNAGSGTTAPGVAAFMLKEFDVIRTVLAPHGDFRLAAASWEVPNTVFQKHPLYDVNTVMMASDLVSSGTGPDQGFIGGKYISTLTYSSKWIPDIPSAAPVAMTPQSTGDYDNAIGRAMDGPLINKPDEGATYSIAGRVPYFDNAGMEFVGGQTFFSPNRQIPSPGMLGSLPTGVKANVPWRTLLFRKQDGHFGSDKLAGGGVKPGNEGMTPDHLLLDLFWMPVVEPYAISDRFSTAGKINMNYQILPFTYIERSTGLHALLKSEKLTVFPNSAANTYKGGGGPFRQDINATNTLSQFTTKFSNGGVFKSASEICDLYVVPATKTLADMPNFYNPTPATANALTGDNTRERIYTTLYPRLTTKSNTYTVHFRAQSLKKASTSSAGTWTEGRDVVTGEYRGSTIIERFIEAGNKEIPDYATDPAATKTLDSFYKWRVVQNRQFAP